MALRVLCAGPRRLFRQPGPTEQLSGPCLVPFRPTPPCFPARGA